MLMCELHGSMHACMPCMQAVYGDILLIDQVRGTVTQLYHAHAHVDGTSGTTPQGRAHAAVAVHEGMLYVVGGVRYGPQGRIVW